MVKKQATVSVRVLLSALLFFACSARAFFEDHGSDLPQEFLYPQNVARAQVGLPPLQWSPKLAQYAQWWADRQATLGRCGLQHSGGPYGENIFWGSGRDWTPTDAVNSWVNERRSYNYFANVCYFYDSCGHYTQIVWRNSKYVGCARVICGDGDVFMSCNYYPRGNFIGQRPY